MRLLFDVTYRNLLLMFYILIKYEIYTAIESILFNYIAMKHKNAFLYYVIIIIIITQYICIIL